MNIVWWDNLNNYIYISIYLILENLEDMESVEIFPLVLNLQLFNAFELWAKSIYFNLAISVGLSWFDSWVAITIIFVKCFFNEFYLLFPDLQFESFINEFIYFFNLKNFPR